MATSKQQDIKEKPPETANDRRTALMSILSNKERLSGLRFTDILIDGVKRTWMDAISERLRAQFGTKHGLLLLSYLCDIINCKDNFAQLPDTKLIPRNVFAVQMHYIPGHYLVSCQKPPDIYVIDSASHEKHVSLVLPQLNLLYESLKSGYLQSSQIKYIVPNSQGCSQDCGPYSVANTVSLLNGIELESTKFIQSRLRPHIIQCLENEHFSPFPAERKTDDTCYAHLIQPTNQQSKLQKETQMIQPKDMGNCTNQIKCPVGCEPVDRGAFPAHCERKAGIHLQWLLQQVASMEHSVQERITATTPREDVQRMAETINLLQGKVKEQERKIQDMANSRLNHRPVENEKEMNSTRRRCQTQEFKNIIFEGIVTTLHGEIERCIAGLERLERHNVPLEEKNAEPKRKIHELERTQSLKDVAISEIDIRVKSLEVTSYDGTLIWKIPDWSRHRRDAVNGKVTSIDSPHFFNGRTGYRLCARLYPNGDGMGKDTHISIFFVVMRGFYDALLSWPFSHPVTFMLLDQNNPDHVIHWLRPDLSSSSFKRPTTDMNIASGCPLFMPLSKLDDTNAAYVKDDVMFIKVVVKSTDRHGGVRPGIIS